MGILEFSRAARTGIRKNAYRLYRGMEIREHKLLYLFFELTRRCNLACLHCGSDCDSRPLPGEFGLEGWVRVARMVAESFDPPPFIVITGGEPLVLPWLYEFGAELKRLGMGWGFVTNGLLLSEGRMASLADAGASSATLSLDGLERSHDRLRGRVGAWRAALNALAILGRSKLAIKDVVTCVHRGNMKELDALAGILRGSGILSWRIFRIFPRGRAAAKGELSLDQKEYRELLGWIESRRPTLRKEGVELSLSCEGWLPFDTDLRVRTTPFFCRSGVNIASILADGSINGCSNNDPLFAQGRLWKDDFRAVWEKGFSPFRDRSWLSRSACAGCSVVRDCEGGSFHAWSPGISSSSQCWMKP